MCQYFIGPPLSHCTNYILRDCMWYTPYCRCYGPTHRVKAYSSLFIYNWSLWLLVVSSTILYISTNFLMLILSCWLLDNYLFIYLFIFYVLSFDQNPWPASKSRPNPFNYSSQKVNIYTQMVVDRERKANLAVNKGWLR